MTLQEFRLGFDRLTKAFPVAKPEDRAEVFFEELRDLPIDLWERVVQFVIRRKDRWQTIAEILEIAQSLTTAAPRALAECSICDGRGGVLILDTVFRARCPHGTTMVPKWVPLAPVTREEIAAVECRLREEWREIYGAEWPQMIAPIYCQNQKGVIRAENHRNRSDGAGDAEPV